MTRYIIIGAGAVGASLAAEFETHEIPYVLVGRGTQIAHIAAHGLYYRRPDGDRVLRLNTADTATPPALHPEDILILAVKAQDVEATTEFWALRQVDGGGFASDLALVTLQNGLAAEDIALRRFDRVYAASIRIPARYTVTGEVVVGGEPNVGIVALGRYPEGLDNTALSIVADLAKAGYLAEARPDIRRWKAAKLEHNVTNAVELFAGPPEVRAKAAASLAQEARTVLLAAGYDPAVPSDWKIDISTWRVAPESGIKPGQQSTWQSFTRGTSSEVDYLNGEIVRLGRIHGVAAPLNAAFQQAAAKLAIDGQPPGTRDISEFYRGIADGAALSAPSESKPTERKNMRIPRVVAISGSFSRPSKTTALVQHVAGRASDLYGFDSVTYDMVDVGPSLSNALWRKQLDSKAQHVIQEIVEADILIIGAPTYKGSYPGLFKHLIDLIDPHELRSKPILITATGGGDRHALMVEHQLRPLFGFFMAHTLPTAVYASDRDFVDYAVSSEQLLKRISEAVDEIGAFFPIRDANRAAAE